ncbi:DUF4214 domain-containing protein [Pseudorhizobium flavum]|uniref:DUF4214 domain-containing protein n=1 Tax=Pseudorhizobium flavum TaxID=1335061 RepID=A0A7X0DF41_9HYPH|nr:DUF4214 domain-containing protein [Pseudorhizobium flavum]MBB6182582.1 hypothetical protein [Pseudorhizobium flavum]CAD6598894.1 hypothetical protein RFYW14_00624 [Pseudorhizobium flavum]
MASIQGIYVALFGRPADPAGLAYFNAETNNGADLTAIGNLASTDEYQQRFTGMSNEEIINSIYQSLFERNGEPAGVQFYLEELEAGRLNINNIAIAILDGAKGDDLAMVTAKIAAANLFTASLDTGAEIDAYDGASAAAIGRAFIDDVETDDPGTQEEVDSAITEIVTGESQSPDQPGGGGGGSGGGGRVPIFTLEDNVLSFGREGEYSIGVGVILNGGRVERIEDPEDMPPYIEGLQLVLLVQHGDEVDTIDILSDGLLNVDTLNLVQDGTVLGINANVFNLLYGLDIGDFTFSGKGTVDLKYVDFFEADETGGDYEASANLGNIISALQEDGVNFTVNGDEAETIRALWELYDERYADNPNDAVNNEALVDLGLRYIEYLVDGDPIMDVVKYSDSEGNPRLQSMHDNLLGNLNASPIGYRFEGDKEAELLAKIPDEFETRPIYSGEYKKPSEQANHDAVREFDFHKGWDRPDYIDVVSNGTVDESGQNANDGLNFGDGTSTSAGFEIARHEGAGIELALKVVERGSNDPYDNYIDAEDGVRVFEADPGTSSASWGTPAKWNFNFSVLTDTNDHPSDIEDYEFVIRLDTNPGAGKNFVEFTLTDIDGAKAWVGEDGESFFGGDEDLMTVNMEQNSVNIGFNQLKGLFEEYADGDEGDFGAGTFDVELVAYKDGVELVGTAVRVEVQDFAVA